MAASPLAIIKEQARQRAEDDGLFLTKSLFFFELRISPKILGPSATQFIFPLVIAPTSYSLSSPFTVEATPTQGGGLYVEENGIVQRTIMLRGNFGWRPRNFPRNATGTQSLFIPIEKRSFSRDLSPFVLSAISGARHFQYLEDAVFNVYADLKRDPSTAEDTKLLFHNPHDKQVWLVVPKKFDLKREAEKRVLYDYDIELLVVDRGDAVDFSISEDKSLLDSLKDSIGQAIAFVNMATGFVNDVKATLAEVSALVKDVLSIVDTIQELAGAAALFVEGFEDIITFPATVIDSLAGAIEGVEVTLSGLVEAGSTDVGAVYLNSWRNMQRAVRRLGMHPGIFESETRFQLRKNRRRQDRDTASFRVTSASIKAPTTLRDYESGGTSPLPGEVDRNLAEPGVGSEANSYSAAKAVEIGQGDTLASLAATHLGDARLWQDIALLNGMKPPFIDAQGGADLGSPANPIPGVFGLGAPLLIPTFSRSPQQLSLLAVLGTRSDESFESQVLGTDFLLEPTSNRKDQYDWVVDVEGGSVDFRFVTGVKNLGQALTTRLTTTKGFNPMYQLVGLDRIVGLNQTNVDFETARFRITAAITADPRVQALRRITFTNDENSPDAIIVDADLAVRGFTQGINVQAIGV